MIHIGYRDMHYVYLTKECVKNMSSRNLKKIWYIWLIFYVYCVIFVLYCVIQETFSKYWKFDLWYLKSVQTLFHPGAILFMLHFFPPRWTAALREWAREGESLGERNVTLKVPLPLLYSKYPQNCPTVSLTHPFLPRAQYETMFACYLGSQDPKAKACHMFGPLPLLK